jgi:hypothetical protein
VEVLPISYVFSTKIECRRVYLALLTIAKNCRARTRPGPLGPFVFKYHERTKATSFGPSIRADLSGRQTTRECLNASQYSIGLRESPENISRSSGSRLSTRHYQVVLQVVLLIPLIAPAGTNTTDSTLVYWIIE